MDIRGLDDGSKEHLLRRVPVTPRERQTAGGDGEGISAAAAVDVHDDGAADGGCVRQADVDPHRLCGREDDWPGSDDDVVGWKEGAWMK